MDDSCAVCAETLKWTAYGPCGHREVCSSCIIRLRFICNDRCCCICKSESSIIFATKSLGDYTKMITNFSAFPANPTEGQVGSYWYHEGTQAYFDDVDHYKMIKNICKLSCSVCDKKDEQKNVGSRKSVEFNSIEQLKSHLFHRHKLFLCNLCLESRKIFISEQKLYNKSQLNQHVKTGDSVIDGNESERGGFRGHPMCEFCQNPFYGDNELYLHMSTEHFTCHICQRRHPGHYEYYKDYDDLEIHFRQEHFLCEDEGCLAKKFVVFATETEMMRHNTMEHGRRISRSKRAAALQIPISFRYRRSNEQDQHGGAQNNHANSSDNQLSLASQDNLNTANGEVVSDLSANTQTVTSRGWTSEIELIVNPFESLATIDSVPSTRYHQVVGQSSGSAPLQESSFPPLPMASRMNLHSSRNGLQGSGGNTMAARLRNQNTVKVINSSRVSQATKHRPNPNITASVSNHTRLVSDFSLLPSSNSRSSFQSSPATVNCYAPSNHASTAQVGPSTVGLFVSSNLSSPGTSRSISSVKQSTLAPEVVGREDFGNSISNFPPVSAINSQPLPKAGDVQSANKALAEKIRAALEFENDKFTAFKVISAEYCQDLIDTTEYLACVHQFGLSHLVLELARLCPNAQKQRELVGIYNYNMQKNGFNENGSSVKSSQSKSKKNSKKGKEKCENGVNCSSQNALEVGHSNGVMNLQSEHTTVEEVSVSSKIGHCSTKGKSKILAEQATLPMDPRCKNDAEASGGDSNKNAGAGGGGNKPRKKTPKFLKNRLGNTLATAEPTVVGCSEAGADEKEEKTDGNKDPSGSLPVRGVWRNGGGRRLVAMTQRDGK